MFVYFHKIGHVTIGFTKGKESRDVMSSSRNDCCYRSDAWVLSERRRNAAQRVYRELRKRRNFEVSHYNTRDTPIKWHATPQKTISWLKPIK